MLCKRCKTKVEEVRDEETGKPLYVDVETKEPACSGAPPYSDYPWHIPSFWNGPNYLIPRFQRYFLAAVCDACDENMPDIEYTKTRGLGGSLPEESRADEMRDVWILNHTLDKHPDRAN